MEFTNVKLKCKENMVKETLSRIGIPNRQIKKIWQTCYLFKKDNEFSIIHFKEFFGILDGGAEIRMDDADYARKYTILRCLEKWNMIEFDHSSNVDETTIFIIPFSDKKNWDIKHKINVAKAGEQYEF